MATALLVIAASALLVGPHRPLLRSSPASPRAHWPTASGSAARAPHQVTLTPEQVAILLQRLQQLEARVEQLESGRNVLAAARRLPFLRVGGRVQSHVSNTAARLRGIAPLPGLYTRLIWGAAMGPANVSCSLPPPGPVAAELRSANSFRPEFLRRLGSLGKDAGAMFPAEGGSPDAAPAGNPMAMLGQDSTTTAMDDTLFFSQLSRTAATTKATGAATAAAFDQAARNAKASVDKVVSDAGRLASSVIPLPPGVSAPSLPSAPPSRRVTRAGLASIVEKREHLLEQRQRLLQQPRDMVERALSAVNSTLGALNTTLALAEKQLASRRLLSASFVLGAFGGLLFHYSLSGFGGGIAAALRSVLRIVAGGFLAAYSSTLANRLGAMARLAAAVALTLWDQLEEKRRQAVFVYHTGRWFERMDAQAQAWNMDRWMSASTAAAEGVSASIAEWYVGTSSILSAAVSGGWNTTMASTSGALLPLGAFGASFTAALAKVDNATGMSHGLGMGAHGVTQGFDAIGKGFAGAGEAFAQFQRDVREWSPTGRGGGNTTNTTDVIAAVVKGEGDVGLQPIAGLKQALQVASFGVQPPPQSRAAEQQPSQPSQLPVPQLPLQAQPPRRRSPQGGFAPALSFDAAAAAETAHRARLALLSFVSLAMGGRRSSTSP